MLPAPPDKARTPEEDYLAGLIEVMVARARTSRAAIADQLEGEGDAAAAAAYRLGLC